MFDFDVRDWTNYNEQNPLNSHEAARFKYTKLLKSACGGFDIHHFTLSCDVTRIVTFPGSLNAETGLICRYMGDRKDLERLNVSSIVWDSRALLYLYDLGFYKACEISNHSHPEPTIYGR